MLASLRGQAAEKRDMVAYSTRAGGTHSQEDLERLYLKSAELKIKHLLEVIDRQQEQLAASANGAERMEGAVNATAAELNKRMAELEAKHGEKGAAGDKST